MSHTSREKLDLVNRTKKAIGQLESVLRALNERSEEHTSELQSRLHLVCRLLLEKKKKAHIGRVLNTDCFFALTQQTLVDVRYVQDISSCIRVNLTGLYLSRADIRLFTLVFHHL